MGNCNTGSRIIGSTFRTPRMTAEWARYAWIAWDPRMRPRAWAYRFLIAMDEYGRFCRWQEASWREFVLVVQICRHSMSLRATGSIGAEARQWECKGGRHPSYCLPRQQGNLRPQELLDAHRRIYPGKWF